MAIFSNRRRACGLMAIALFSAHSATADSIASLSTTAFIDSHANPAPRVAENGSICIDLCGDWFASGACELLVDGTAVASSSGALQTYCLAADPATWRSYELTLRSQEGETTKFVTIFPYPGFVCSLHTLSFVGCTLDARPAGTVRKIRNDEALPVVWSAIWNDGAEAPVVALRKGNDPDGPLVGTLVFDESDPEGEASFSPRQYNLGLGLYTLTHFDGVETLTSVVEVRGRGLILVVL